MATTKSEKADLPRRIKGRVNAIETVLESGPDIFLASRNSGEETSRQCLTSLFSLASSLHTPQLPYYSKSLETSRKKNVTVEQIWGQMNMLLRPVMRRLQDNVKRAQKTLGTTDAQNGSSTRRKAKRLRDNNDNDESDLDDENKDNRKVPSAKLSDINESDLDEEIEQLLNRKQQNQKRKQHQIGKGDLTGINGDDEWRYAFGKGTEEENDEEDDDLNAENNGSEEDDDDNNNDDVRIRRRHARAMAAAGKEEEEEDDDEENRGDEELAALKEMYGDDFVPEEGDDAGLDDDSQLEEDLAWDDPSLTFNERDGKYWGKDDILAEDGENEYTFHHQQEGDGFHLPGMENADEANEEEEEDEELNDPNLTELQRERIRERRLVEKLEQERLYSTQWAMTGEVAGKSRPRDALLDEELDFEHAMKAVPVITAAVTARLEDRIRRRILDSNFDDVQRRAAASTPADLTTTRRDASTDAEKSKLSLMDLYERDYLARAQAQAEAQAEQQITAEPLTEVEKDELRAIQMWRRLAQHLDALSNFHYTPKPAQEDLAARVRAVEGQAPAITVESVGNFATTREAALAPQDLYRGANRKFADVGANELAPRERRALRHAKKEHTSAARERKEKRVEESKKIRQQKLQLQQEQKQQK